MFEGKTRIYIPSTISELTKLRLTKLQNWFKFLVKISVIK